MLLTLLASTGNTTGNDDAFRIQTGGQNLAIPCAILSADDKRMAIAIEKSSIIAISRGEDGAWLQYGFICLIIEYCRATWDKKGEFIDYVKSEINKERPNCSYWHKYYEAFYESKP